MTPWTAAYQAPRSMGFSRQEYWSGVPFNSSRSLLIHSCIFPILFSRFFLIIFTIIILTFFQVIFLFFLHLFKSQWGEERRHPCPVLSERIQPQVWCWTQVFGDAVYRVEEVPFYSCIFYWEFLSRVGVEFCQVPFCILIKWYFFSSLLIWLISQVDFWILYQPWVTGRMVMYISFCILMNSVYHGLYRIFTPVYLRAVFSFSTVPCTIFSTDFCARLMLASSSGLGNVSLLLCFLK